MFGVERLQTIREIVIKNKSVEVVKLSKELDVSEVTIRRDLDKLEKEGLVIKTYGGAILIDEMISPSYRVNEPTKEVENENVDKVVIDVASTAAKLISNGDTIFIDGSMIGKSLVYEVLELKHLVIVTNSIEIAYGLFKNSKHKVVILGGELDELGCVTEYEELDELLIEKAFINVDGIDLDVGYTVNDKKNLRLYKKLKNVSRDIYVMVNSDAFNKRSLVKMTPLDQINAVITDKYIPEVFKTYYFDNNITLHSSMLSQI